MNGRKLISDIKNLIFRFQDDEVIALSSQLAYSFILAFFPFLIFLMTLAGFSSLKSEDVLAGISTILPQNAYELIKKTVVEIVDTRRTNLLSFSLLFTIWSASSGFNAVIRGLNKAYDEEERRGIIKVQLTAFACTIGLALIIILAFLMLVFGEKIGDYLVCCYSLGKIYEYLWDILRFAIMAVAMIFGFGALYLFAPSRRLTWKEVIPGAIFTTAGWTITSIGFAFYVNNFNNYSYAYGSIGAVIVLMTWLFFSSVIIIMGGELNAALAFDREGKEKLKGKRY